MTVVPVRNYNSLTRRGEVGAVAVIFDENVVRNFGGEFFVTVRAIERSDPMPKVLMIDQPRLGLVQVAKEDLKDWQPKGALY